jgi:hypothetical protein
MHAANRTAPRASRAREIRQVACDRHCAPALLLEGLPNLIELFAVPADKYDSAVLGQLECRGATYA